MDVEKATSVWKSGDAFDHDSKILLAQAATAVLGLILANFLQKLNSANQPQEKSDAADVDLAL